MDACVAVTGAQTSRCRSSDPETALWVVLPGVVVGAAVPRRTRPAQRGGDVVPAGRVNPPGGETGAVPGVASLSKSQVIDVARELGEQIEAFRSRPLDQSPYSLLAATRWCSRSARAAASCKCTRCWRPANRDGHREILGLDVTTAEDGAGWLAFFRGLLAAAGPGSSWSPATRTPVCWRRSARPCPAPRGNGAAPTTR